jgi:hypothetical protein
MMIWRSTLRAGFLVQLPEMEPQFARALADQVATGLTGRGSCQISPQGRLFASFGLTSDEADSGAIISAYAAELLKHLRLPANALLAYGVNQIEPRSELLDKTDRAIQALGLRALNPPDFR